MSEIEQMVLGITIDSNLSFKEHTEITYIKHM